MEKKSCQARATNNHSLVPATLSNISRSEEVMGCARFGWDELEASGGCKEGCCQRCKPFEAS